MSDTELYRPAFFELYTAEHLSASLRPALRFVLEVLSVRYPRLVRLASRSDEIFTSLLLVLETSQLRKDSALLSESFYSLRRTAAVSFQANDLKFAPLSRKQIVLSVFFSVVIPHLKSKLDMWYSNATGGAAAELFDSHIDSVGPVLDNDDNASQPPSVSNASLLLHNPSSRLAFLKVYMKELQRRYEAVRTFVMGPAFQRLALKWYPRITSVGESINLAYNFMYLFGHTNHFSFSLALQGLVLRRLSAGELLLDMSRSSAVSSPGTTGISLSNVASAASERILGIFKTGFFASIFAFRFLQYYYAAEVCCDGLKAIVRPFFSPI